MTQSDDPTFTLIMAILALLAFAAVTLSIRNRRR